MVFSASGLVLQASSCPTAACWWVPSLQGVATLIAVLATIVAARRALRQYEARWTVELFNRFYTKDEYREVYLALDGANSDLLAKMHAVVADNQTDDETEWKLTRYLNFFEVVMSLVERRDLPKRVVDIVLKYPLERLMAQKGMGDYLREEKHGYEALKDFAKRWEKARANSR